MSAAFRRPKLTHMPHQVFARQEREAARMSEIARDPDPYFCTFCGVATWTPYSRRQPGLRQWLKPVSTACDDPDCRARVDAAVERPSGVAA